MRLWRTFLIINISPELLLFSRTWKKDMKEREKKNIYLFFVIQCPRNKNMIPRASLWSCKLGPTHALTAHSLTRNMVNNGSLRSKNSFVYIWKTEEEKSVIQKMSESISQLFLLKINTKFLSVETMLIQILFW